MEASTYPRSLESRTVALTLVLVVSAAAMATAQGVSVSGRLYHSVSSKPIAGATVAIEGTKLEVKSGPDGSYSIPNVPAGPHHLVVTAAGFVSSRSELTVAETPMTLDVAVDPELHYSEVVSVSPDARNQFDSYQPTSVLAGADLAKQLEGTVGATLATQPGVAERSFGPGPSRPVIRGLDGDRVLILDDGQRVGDLSSQSGDHGVVLNPTGAARIEIVRGPATLLYGANAIGGLVNVISDTIPTTRVNGVSGGLTADLGTADSEVGAAGHVLYGNNQWAVHASGSGQRSGDVDTPEGTIDNSQSRGGFGSVGVAWTGERGYFGGSYGYDNTKNGWPYVEEGLIQLTPRRQMFGLRAGRTTSMERSPRSEPCLATASTSTTSSRATRSAHSSRTIRRISTFRPSISRGDADRDHRRIVPRAGVHPTRAEVLSPPVDENAFALFLDQELNWPHVTVQFGGRLNWAGYSQRRVAVCDFTDGSGSVGILFGPAAANES